MGWKRELDEFVSKSLRYVFMDSAGQPARFDREEYEDSHRASVEGIVEEVLKEAFIKGHAAGANAALEMLPEDVRNIYTFEPESDAIYAERTWLKIRGDI